MRWNRSGGGWVRTIGCFAVCVLAAAAQDRRGASPLTDKTLVVWARPDHLEQKGAGVVSIQEGPVFDSVVLGEVRPGVWMPGSDRFNRTETRQEAWPREEEPAMRCVAVVYEGTAVRMYLDGRAAADYAIQAPVAFSKDASIFLGKRHDKRGHFAGRIAEARIYDRALTASQIAGLTPAAAVGTADPAGTPYALWTFRDGSPREETGRFPRCRLYGGARIEDGHLVLDGKDDFLGMEPDYASAVPRRARYADTLDGQLAELRDDPQLLRFAEARRRNLADSHHPRFHFVAPENRMNDPNGLCFWQGRWHLFYQGYPPEDPRQHWGHAVSEDLIHWRDLPYAIYPDPERCCFSGSALAEDDRVIAMYHGTEVGTMVAVSDDPLLLNWEKVTGAPVIPFAKPGDPPLPYNIFDPCIWKEGGMYYALTAGTLPEGPGGKRLRAEFLHRSKDLAVWEYMHPFLENDRYGLVGDDGACPYFWPLGDRHILLHFSHMSGGKYLLGDYDTERHKFVVTDGGDFNHRAVSPGGVHAPSACPDGKGGVVAIFNMNPGKPSQGWNQIMSLPLQLGLSDRGRLSLEPAGDLASLRDVHRRIEAVDLPANRDVRLEGIEGGVLELDAEIDVRGAPVIELSVLHSPAMEEATRIRFYREGGYRNPDRTARAGALAIDTSRSSELPDAARRPPEIADVVLAPDEPLRLRVFIDRSVVEVFANGRQYLAVRVYPGRADSVGVSLRSQGRDARLVSMDAWTLRGIYE